MSSRNVPCRPPADPISTLYLGSSAAAPRLRVGVVIDEDAVSRVALGVLDELRRANFVEVVCAIVARNGEGAAAKPAAQTIDARSPLGARLYERWIDSTYRYENDPFDRCDATGALAGYERLDTAAADAPARIRDLHPHVLLDLSRAALPDALAALSEYGLWSFYYGRSDEPAGSAPYLRELIAQEPVMSVELRARTTGSTSVLARAQFSGSPFPSLRVTRRGPGCGSQHLVIQKLNELHRYGWQHVLDARPEAHACGASQRSVDEGRRLLSWTIARGTQKLASRLRLSPEIDHWRVGVRKAATPLLSEPEPQRALRDVQWLDSPKGVYWADPFLFRHGEDLWLFIEEFPYSSPRAHLSCVKLEDPARIGAAIPVLKRPYHLSYPHLIEHGGEIFMVPETAQSGRVELYRARRFPDEWELVTTLLDMACVDTTLTFHSGSWWMLTSPLIVESHAPITLLFQAPELTGPWTHHPSSPISRDVRRARGAGNIFMQDSRLIRPSQDCSVEYGYALVFNEITRLDAEQYAEKEVLRVLPSMRRDLRGVHTYNRVGDVEVVDGKFRMAPSDVK